MRTTKQDPPPTEHSEGFKTMGNITVNKDTQAQTNSRTVEKKDTSSDKLIEMQILNSSTLIK